MKIHLLILFQFQKVLLPQLWVTITEGYLSGLDQKVGDFIPEFSSGLANQLNRWRFVKHVLRYEMDRRL